MIVKPHDDTEVLNSGAATRSGYFPFTGPGWGARGHIHTTRALLTCITVFLPVYLERFRPGWAVARQRSPEHRNVSSWLRCDAHWRRLSATRSAWMFFGTLLPPSKSKSCLHGVLDYKDIQHNLHASHSRPNESLYVRLRKRFAAITKVIKRSFTSPASHLQLLAGMVILWASHDWAAERRL